MFVVSKVVGALVQPLNMIFLILAIGIVLLFTRKWRAGRTMLAVLLVVLTVIAVLPWSAWLVRPLENRFSPPTTLPARIDGIVILGGAIDPVVSATRGMPSINSAVERITSAVELALRHPEAKIVFSGGSGAVLTQDLKEAPWAKAFLAGIGFATERVIFEGQSRNTWENAGLSKALAEPGPGETWLLVTSALHMPRSVGAFRAAGWTVLPYPVDYTTPADGGDSLGFNPGGGLSALGTALHEWQGLIYYRLRGWSDSLYPGPTGGL